MSVTREKKKIESELIFAHLAVSRCKHVITVATVLDFWNSGIYATIFSWWPRKLDWDL